MPQISRSQTPGPREGANAIEPRQEGALPMDFFAETKKTFWTARGATAAGLVLLKASIELAGTEDPNGMVIATL
jgi:hypothetical protein